MTRRKILLLLLVAGLVGTVYIGPAVGQDGDRGGRDGRRDRSALTDEQRAQRMEEWRARTSERLRERVGATEEEWESLSPLIDQVQSLSRQVQTGGMAAMFGRDRRAGGDESESDEEPTDIQAATQALQELVDDETATSAQFSDGIEALQAAKAVVEAELDEAKQALRSAVTMRQDAQFVLMGLLD